MHTLREPLLKKQSSPENDVSAGLSPNRSCNTDGQLPQVSGRSEGKRLIIALGVTAVIGFGVVAYGNAQRIDAVLVGAWSDFTSSPVHKVAPITKTHVAIAMRAVPGHPSVNQGVLNYERAVKDTSPLANSLPQWIQAAIVKDDAALTEAQKANGALSARIAQIHTQNQQLATHVRQLQGTVLNDQVRINQLEGQLHAVASRPRQVSNATQNGGAGLVALQAAPNHAVSVGGRRKSQKRTAQGWVVVALHGDKAVLQTPGGQVALVKQGQLIGGKRVDGIDDTAKTVTLSGGLVAHIFGK